VPVRRLVITLSVFVSVLAAAATAMASPSGILISQFRTRTASSQYDDYAQITNTANAAVDLSGWQLYDCFQSGGAQKVGTESDPLPKGTKLPASASFVFGKDDGDYTGVADAT
jgi:hypothetical protein